MIDDGFGLVPWRPVLEQRIGQHITGVMRDSGIEWDVGEARAGTVKEMPRKARR